jgi:hypothetical protein
MLIKLFFSVLCSLHLSTALEGMRDENFFTVSLSLTFLCRINFLNYIPGLSVRTDGFPAGNPQNWGHISMQIHIFLIILLCKV